MTGWEGSTKSVETHSWFITEKQSCWQSEGVWKSSWGSNFCANTPTWANVFLGAQGAQVEGARQETLVLFLFVGMYLGLGKLKLHVDFWGQHDKTTKVSITTFPTQAKSNKFSIQSYFKAWKEDGLKNLKMEEGLQKFEIKQQPNSTQYNTNQYHTLKW